MSQNNKKKRQLANILVYPLCQFGLKNKFLFFFGKNQLQLISRPKTMRTSLNAMFSAKQHQNLRKKHWNQVNTVFSVKIWPKNLINRKKNLNCADLPIFCLDNCQNTANQLKLRFPRDHDEICLKTPNTAEKDDFCKIFR